jgi:hypothetical protein
MARFNESFHEIMVENFFDAKNRKVRVRPTPGGMYPTNLMVECPREMRDVRRYPLGTRFMIRAKLTDREGGVPFLYSHHSWHYRVIGKAVTR